MVGLAKAFYALGSIWAVLAVGVVLLALRAVPGRVARRARRCRRLGPGAAAQRHPGRPRHRWPRRQRPHRRRTDLPGGQRRRHHRARLRLAPYLVRPFRRILAVVIVLVSLAALYLGAGFPSDVLGGLLLGFAAGAARARRIRRARRRPSVAEVRDALTDMGYDVASIAAGRRARRRAAVMDVVLDNRRPSPGRRVRPRPARRAARGQGLAQGDVPRPRPPRVREPASNRWSTSAYALMLAERAKVRAARLVATGVGGADAAVLVTTPPCGQADRCVAHR